MISKKPDHKLIHVVAHNFIHFSAVTIYYKYFSNKDGSKKSKSTKTKPCVIQTITRYQTANCNGCPLRGICHQFKGYKNKAAGKRKSKEQKKEFVPAKNDLTICSLCSLASKIIITLNASLLRSKPKVEIETVLLALAHNLQKKALPPGRKSA